MSDQAPEQESPIITYLRKYMMGHEGVGGADQRDSQAAMSVDASSDTAHMADGGEVMDPKDTVGLPGVPEPVPTDPVVATGLPGVPALPGTAPSEHEKKDMVMKHLKEKPANMALGGVPSADGSVDPSQLPLTPDAPQDSKMQAILRAIGMAGKAAVSPLTAIANPVMNAASSVADKVTPLIPQAVQATNDITGLNLPVPAAPAAAPASEPAPLPNPPPLDMGTKATAPKPAAKAAPAAPAADPLAGLGKFDPSSVTPGMNPEDRQALAGGLDASQHTYGNYLAEALAGLGDAVAAKGGVRQNALGNIFALQTQQRHEALENFDKARQAAVEHFTMKNQADQNLINNLKARGELSVSPGIAGALGHPELAGKPVSQAELVIKTDGMKYDFANKMQERKQAALKNSADEIDKAIAGGGIFGTKKAVDTQSRLRMIHAQAIKNDPEAFGYSVTGGN